MEYVQSPEKVIVANLVRIFPVFMDPEGSYHPCGGGDE
jgi:hypothetical protein